MCARKTERETETKRLKLKCAGERQTDRERTKEGENIKTGHVPFPIAKGCEGGVDKS